MMEYQVVFLYLALMLSQVLGDLQLQKDEKENRISNIHRDLNKHSLNEEYKTTRTIVDNTKPLVKTLTTTTLKSTTTHAITTSASLSPFRISVPVHPPISVRDNTPLYYNNRFLQIPNGYLPYSRPQTMSFPTYQHLHPSRSNLVGYFYDFPVYKKQVPVGIHFNK